MTVKGAKEVGANLGLLLVLTAEEEAKLLNVLCIHMYEIGYG